MFVALNGGALVHAEACEHGSPTCPVCGADLFHKDSNEVAAHFSHYPESGACSYESDEHLQMKWHAAQVAQDKWGCEVEVDERRIGAYVPDVIAGGVCIEVVVTNEGDRSAKEAEYQDHGYRTLYIYSRDNIDRYNWFTDWADVGHAEWCDCCGRP